MQILTALVSVSKKEGIVELARRLQELGVTILSTGGTARTLEQENIRVVPVSQYTGFPEILDGRVKTLHPRIHGGILALHDHPEHQRVLKDHGISPIGLVVVNLYPFVETIQRSGVGTDEAIEQIDIGGPSMIRAAAKNYRHVTVVVDPEDYSIVLEEIRTRNRETTEATRLRLARKAFGHTADYDSAIVQYLESITAAAHELPPSLSLNLARREMLRYGENPHQRAALYVPRGAKAKGLLAARQLQGKQLSFNNYVDLEAAWALCCEFTEPFCAIIKHTNPCGAAVGRDPAEAYRKALDCDPVSAFGSVIGFNCPVESRTVESIGSLFVEAIVAPGYDPGALEMLASSKNLRVMEIDARSGRQGEWDFKYISGGFLVQDPDLHQMRKEALKTVTRRVPDEREMEDLLFAWRVGKHVKSNAIVYARGGQTLGIGAGQMSRVDSARLAAEKARSPLVGCVAASDAFFPFRDGIDQAAQAGVTAVIQPGGSVRDEEVIRAADEHGIAMVFTGIRHFKH